MKNKNRIILSVACVILSVALLVFSTVLVKEKIINSMTAFIFITLSGVLVLTAIFRAAKVEYDIVVYECRKCGHLFKPTFKAYILGAHTITTRHLKCPECSEKSWCVRKQIK